MTNTQKSYVISVIIATIVAVVLIIGGGEYFAVKNQTRKNHGQSGTNTSEWKTYRNDQFGFEVKYPALWKVGTGISSNYSIYSSTIEFCPPELATSDPEVVCKVKNNNPSKPSTLAPFLLFIDKSEKIGRQGQEGLITDNKNSNSAFLELSNQYSQNSEYGNIYKQMLATAKFVNSTEPLITSIKF